MEHIGTREVGVHYHSVLTPKWQHFYRVTLLPFRSNSIQSTPILYLLATRDAEGYIISRPSSVCLYVCQAITFESLDVGYKVCFRSSGTSRRNTGQIRI